MLKKASLRLKFTGLVLIKDPLPAGKNSKNVPPVEKNDLNGWSYTYIMPFYFF